MEAFSHLCLFEASWLCKVEGFYKWLAPLSDAVNLAFRLRTLGHGDNIDNLLYVTFMENDMLLLTMGEDLELLQNN